MVRNPSDLGVVRLGRVRVIVPTKRGHVRSLGNFVKGLQQQGRKIIFVSADRPYAGLMQSMADEGVSVADVHFVDTVSSLNGTNPIQRPANATFLPSPTMLEMLAMRIEQVAQRLGANAHVVLDSLNTLSLYNGVQPVQEFSHYLANRLRAHGVNGDLVIHGGEKNAVLHDMIIGFCDDRLELSEAE